MALTYAYDRNGNKVGNTERGTFAWPMPSLVDETSRFTASGRITNRVDALSPTNNFTYQHDASGNMTNAFGSGQNWRLVYDEDNRVTALSWDCGLTHKDITNRYDALGRRIARKLDGVETRYVLDLSGGMERILCDTTASGQVTAWYIHGPGLCYRVDASNNILCYHADAQANIIVVTDGGGTNVAQYAYTPYGRSLGSTNLQSQISNPYLFVGSQGVMEELPALYFMRVRYYSAVAGVFLSTDQIKKIGPRWKPVVYAYAELNLINYGDPKGQFSSLFYDIPNWGVKIAMHQMTLEDAAKEFDEGAALEIAGDVVGLNPLVGEAIGWGLTAKGMGEDLASGKGIPGLVVKSFIWAANDPITANGGTVANSTPMLANSGIKGQSSGSGGALIANQFMSSRTITAAIVAPIVNSSSTKPAGSSNNGGGGSGGSGGSTTSSTVGSTSYTVKAGDTLGNIGSKFGSTATAIGAANGIQNLNLIHPGQVLTIPRR